MTIWGYGVWAFAAGALIPVMATLSGALGRTLGSTQWTAPILFAIALSVSLVVALASRQPAPLAALQNARPEQLAAGLIVVFYLLSVTYLTPRFGVAPTILCVVVAQIVTSAMIGHFGWLGAPRQPVDVLKVAGLALMIGGLLLSQIRRGGV